jgi:hypothetical protein
MIRDHADSRTVAPLLLAAALALFGCEDEGPPLPEPRIPAPGDSVVAAPEIPGESQAFLDMQLPPGQFVRVLPTGTAYGPDEAPAFRSLCLNCHAVSQTSFTVDAWSESAHARAGIMCGACHGAHEEAFVAKPGPEQCRTCHAAQYDETIASAHGPEKAPGMGCSPCHEIHATDRRIAVEVTTCTGCHLESSHVMDYASSRMGVVFLREGYDEEGDLRAPDCVYCHMPPSPLMAQTGDFRNDRVTLHNSALTVQKHEKDPRRLSDEAIDFLTPLCVKCHSERNSRHRLENSEALIRNWTPIGMTRETLRKPVPDTGAGAEEVR